MAALISCRGLRADVALSHQAWSVEEGLPQASVHQVFQSRDGYLWLATEGGIARFDGYSFKAFTHQTEPAISSDDVSAIAETSSALWFGTAGGLLRYQQGRWRRFAEQDGLSSSTVLALATTPEGTLLVLTARGTDRFDGNRFQSLPAHGDAIGSMQQDRDDAVLLLGETAVWRYQRGVLQRQDAGAAALQGLQHGPDGAVWTRTMRSVTVKTPLFQRELQIGRDLPRGRTTALLVDRQGTGWIGTNHGLFFVRTSAASTLQGVDALRTDAVLSLFEDREGNLWIGTETTGLHVLRPRKFFAEPAAAGEAVSAGTVTPDGTLWFGMENDGVRRVRNGVAEQTAPMGSLTSPIVLAMAHGPAGDVWVSTPDGLNHIAGSRVETYTAANGLPDDYVRSVLVDGRGTAWAGTRQGLVSIQGKRLQMFTRKDGLGSDSIGPLVGGVALAGSQAGADLWIGTAAGLAHLHGGRIDNFAGGPDPAQTTVTALAREDDGTLWVGLHGQGLAMFSGSRFLPVHGSGLPAEVTALAVDAEGYLWLRGARRVDRIPLAALHACAGRPHCDLSPEHFDVADGMPSDAVAPQGMPAIWKSDDGRLWFPTRKGIGVVDPAHLPLNRMHPPVVIQRLLVDDTDIPLDGGTIKLESGHNRCTFEYAALSYTLPAKNRYRYRLEGFDGHWIDAGALRSASYTGLPPGSYRFRVEARNNDGVWNHSGAEVQFRILPPVYRTWWFLCLVVLVAVLLTLGALWLQARAVQRRFQLVLAERTRIARDVHDTLAQDLVSVSLQLNLAKRYIQTDHVDLAGAQLDATRKLVTAGLEAVRQSIWNLRADPHSDSLPTRMTQLARPYAQTEHPPQIRIGGAFRKLAPRMEEEVLRIAQESLSNACRHASATQVSLTLHYDTDALTLTILDNGAGFSLDEAKTMQGHYGLIGMKERADALGAQLTMTSAKGRGTTVQLYLPLADKENRAR